MRSGERVHRVAAGLHRRVPALLRADPLHPRAVRLPVLRRHGLCHRQPLPLPPLHPRRVPRARSRWGDRRGTFPRRCARAVAGAPSPGEGDHARGRVQ
eukprot:2796218-Rhodomonas_salina.1